MLEEIDGWGVVAEYFDGIERADAVEDVPGEAGADPSGGILERVRSWFG